MADTQPYGDVAYADPGYQKDGKKRYPIDSADHVRAAWSYINQADNASQYTSEQLASIKSRIRAAAKKFGIQIADAQQNSFHPLAERRYTRVAVEIRQGAGMTIGGYAAKFDRKSENLGGFVERIAPGFFNKSRGDKWPGVVARYNHDDNHLLGTTAAGTLRLNLDEVGMLYDVDLPNSRADVHELVQRGDVRQSSFAFVMFEDEWEEHNGFPLRTLVSGRLIDVAPVNTPAYEDTSVGLRSLAAKFSADPEEVRQLAQRHELLRFFKRTDVPTEPPRASAVLARVKGYMLDV